MQQDTVTAAADTVPHTVPDAEYAFAEAILRRVARAATDAVFRSALYETYALGGLLHLIPGLVRAIDEYRDNHAGELVTA